MSVAVALLSVLLLVTAVSVVAARSPIVSALALVGNLVTVAAFYAVMNAHFLAAVQILVYAGAIVVLVLFVLMLLNIKGESRRASDFLLQAGAALAAGLFLVLVFPFFSRGEWAFGGSAPEGTVKAIGRLVYTDYVYCFEVASILILIAVVGAVTLGRRARIPSLGQSANEAAQK